MSFNELKSSEISKINERSCIIAVNFNKKESITIKNVSRMIGIKEIVFVDSTYGNSTIYDILNDNLSIDNEKVWGNKGLIFNNITQLKINGFLESLKKMKIVNSLSAIVTDTNIEWSLNKLIYNLVKEREALKCGKTINH